MPESHATYPYAGTYINLDRRPDLRASMETELARCGLSGFYERFAAVEGNALGFSNPHLSAGEMGCFSSHYLVLEKHLGETQPLHIIEDDVVLAAKTGDILRWAAEQPFFSQYDIIYTDVWMPLRNDILKQYKKSYDATMKRGANGHAQQSGFTIIDLRGVPYGSTSSYIVNPKSIAKLHAFYAQGIASEPQLSNDLFLRKLLNEGALNICCLFPFATTVQLDHIVDTDIGHSYHQLSALATHLARYGFFIDADYKALAPYLDRLPPPDPGDENARILTHLLSFSMTDNFEHF